MRIVTWNINSIRLRLNLLKKLNDEFNPDIIALQETKCADEFFPFDAIRDMGFEHIAFSGEKSYNGVAILAKNKIAHHYCLTFYNNDKRHISIRLDDIEIHNFYVPAGGDIPDPEVNTKFKHKLSYVQLIQDWFATNCDPTQKIILVGDLNIAPFEHDVWSSKQLRNVVSHTDIERQALNKLRDSFGFIDSARYFIPINEKLYTWWSYRNRDWEKSNRGRRLDHIWVSPALKHNLLGIESVKAARNWEMPSDHVPFILDLKL